MGRTGEGDGDYPRMALLRVNDDLFYGTSRSGGESGTGSRPHAIESSTNLTTWADLTTLTTPIHGRTTYTDTLTAQATFFRVRQ